METGRMPVDELLGIPGVGKSIARNLRDIGITRVKDLIRKDPELLYEMSNRRSGAVRDRCLLYAFRCAVYYANTEASKRRPEKMKWWNWSDERLRRDGGR